MKKISIILFFAFGLSSAFCPPINGVQQIETSSGACITDCLKLDNKNKRKACVMNQVGKLKECESYYCKINKNNTYCKMDEKILEGCKEYHIRKSKGHRR